MEPAELSDAFCPYGNGSGQSQNASDVLCPGGGAFAPERTELSDAFCPYGNCSGQVWIRRYPPYLAGQEARLTLVLVDYAALLVRFAIVNQTAGAADQSADDRAVSATG